MPTDLETEIRDALRDRASRVTADQLRGTGHPIAVARRPPWALLTAATAVLLLLAGVLAWVTVGRNGSDAAGLREQLIRRWTVTDVDYGLTTYGPGPGLIIVTFRPDDTVVAEYDRLVHRATFQVDGDHLVTTPDGPLLGNSSADPNLRPVYDGLDKLFVGDYTHQPVTSDVQLQHGELQIRISGYTILLHTCEEMACDRFVGR